MFIFELRAGTIQLCKYNINVYRLYFDRNFDVILHIDTEVDLSKGSWTKTFFDDEVLSNPLLFLFLLLHHYLI